MLSSDPRFSYLARDISLKPLIESYQHCIAEVIQEIFVVNVLVYCLYDGEFLCVGINALYFTKDLILPTFLTVHHHRLYIWP
jgi:hypothetical protein